jgi:hypothetical protein
MQCLHRVNVIYAYMISHIVLPNISCIHKCVEIKMEDGSKPLHKFTNLCREVMWLKSSTADGISKLLFNAIMPIVSGHKQGSAIITYCTDDIEAASFIFKIQCSVAGCFFGYWRNAIKNRLEMVQKLMESFDVDAALLACFSEFNPATLIVKTTFRDVDEQLEGVKADLGIDEGWNAELKGEDGNRVEKVGH